MTNVSRVLAVLGFCLFLSGAASAAMSECADFSGSWVGTCSGPYQRPVHVVIQQNDCSQMSWNSESFPINETTTTSSTVQSGKKTIAYTAMTHPYWSNDKSILSILNYSMSSEIGKNDVPTESRVLKTLSLIGDRLQEKLELGGAVATCEFSKSN